MNKYKKGKDRLKTPTKCTITTFNFLGINFSFPLTTEISFIWFGNIFS